jgi:hypothetical protein
MVEVPSSHGSTRTVKEPGTWRVDVVSEKGDQVKRKVESAFSW